MGGLLGNGEDNDFNSFIHSTNFLKIYFMSGTKPNSEETVMNKRVVFPALLELTLGRFLSLRNINISIYLIDILNKAVG